MSVTREVSRLRLVSARPVSPVPLARLLLPQTLHEFEDVRREAIGLLGASPPTSAASG